MRSKSQTKYSLKIVVSNLPKGGTQVAGTSINPEYMSSMVKNERIELVTIGGMNDAHSWSKMTVSIKLKGGGVKLKVRYLFALSL